MNDTQSTITNSNNDRKMTSLFTPNSSTPNMTLSSTSIVGSTSHNTSSNSTEQQQRDEWEAMFDPQYTHLRRLTARKDTSPGPSPAETPTLPRIDHVKVQAPCPDQIDILPCPSSSFAKQQRNEARLGLLQTIHEQGLADHHDTWKLMDQREPYKNWQERLQEKINEDQDFDTPRSSAPHHRLTVDTMINDDNEEKKSIATTTIMTKQNKNDGATATTRKPIRRRSFLYFAFGFLFPPLWIVGALHIPPKRHHPGSQTVDLLWKRRSRNAFFIFIVTVLVILILTLVLKPSSIGWRTSSNNIPNTPPPS